MNLYSLIVNFSVILLIYLVKKYSRTGLTEENFWKLIFFVIINSLIGAKIFHLLENLNFYMSNPQFIEVSKGYSILGSIIFGYLTINFFERKFKTDLLNIKINLFLFLPVIQMIGRLGNITNHELLPFSYYEIFLNLLNFLILFYIYKFKDKRIIPFCYFINYGILRLFIEILKGNLGFLFFSSILIMFYGFFHLIKLRLKV